MSKMSQLHAELSEQAADLGFENIGEAEQAGYGVDWEKGRLMSPEEAAHEAWLREKHETLHLLESVKEDIIELNDGDSEHVAIEELNQVIEFVEQCHD